MLGLDPPDPPGRAAGGDDRLTAAVDAWSGLLEQRAAARAAKDFAPADAIRDRQGRGIEVEDTPQGPKWSL